MLIVKNRIGFPLLESLDLFDGFGTMNSMNILSVDFGSYSLKCLEIAFEKKGPKIVSRYHKVFPSPLVGNLEDIQIQSLHHFLKENPFDGPIVLNYPSKKLTYRFFNLPVTQKKKVEMMIPFQLDKNLLLSSQEIQTAYHLITGKKQTYVLASIAEIQQYETFYKNLLTFPFFPEVHTSEISALMNFVINKNIEGPCCFLDVGHETTKAYIVQNKKIVAGHLSFFGGKVIDEVLAETYQISLSEAIDFKMQKSFFLTEQQLSQADQEQQDFAKIMRQIFSPLLSDLQKWELGHRVNFGRSFSTIFLYGGTSQIKNMTAFFTQEMGVKTQLFQPIYEEYRDETYFDEGELACFSNCFLMGESLVQKMPLQNFFKGPFGQHQQADLPIHALAFALPRYYLVLLIIFFIGIADYVSLNKKQKIYDQSLTSLFKGPLLNLSRNEQRKAKENPSEALKKLQAQEETIQKQMLFYQQIDPIIGLKPFFQIHDLLTSTPDWELKSFAMKDTHIYLRFSVPQKKMIESINQVFKQQSFTNMQTHYDDALQVYSIEYDI